tara:strand:- start:177 stop:830 length:654 start_codon:yes stop_codon:yes gene_type:complete
LIGLFIGVIQSIAWFVLNKFGWPIESLVLISLSLGYWITGGLHLDGLIDTADGIAAGKEKCIKAMKDSRVGASGIQAFFLIVSLQIATLIKIGDLALLVIPMANFLGRVSPLWAIEYFPYLFKEGKGSFHKKNWKGYLEEIKPSVITIIVISPLLIYKFISNIQYLSLLIFIFLGIISTFIIPHLIGNRLGGHSGDSYGASVVLVETFIFLLAAIFS